MRQLWKKLPRLFLERLQCIVPKHAYFSVLQSFCEKKPTTLRVNTLKTTASRLRSDLSSYGLKLDTVNWYKDAFVLTKGTLRQLQSVSFYKEGFFYVQNLSSMLPPLILSPEKNMEVLDITAAPGSKSTQISTMMCNQGRIVANDINNIRLYKLEANLQKQGVKNVTTSIHLAQTLWKLYPEYFDRVLADVPCSTEGKISCFERKSYETWSTAKIKDLVRQQRAILLSAVHCAKVGGIVVYSTCTLAPEENEAVIDWILEKEKHSIRLESINIAYLNTEQAISYWDGKFFHPEVRKTIRILPSKHMEGFFVAKIRKVDTTIQMDHNTISSYE